MGPKINDIQRINSQNAYSSNKIGFWQIDSDKQVELYINKQKKLQAYVYEQEKTLIIPSYDISGIPQEVLAQPEYLLKFLENTWAKLTPYDNGDYSLRVNQRLQGGGFWECMTGGVISGIQIGIGLGMISTVGGAVPGGVLLGSGLTGALYSVNHIGKDEFKKKDFLIESAISGGTSFLTANVSMGGAYLATKVGEKLAQESVKGVVTTVAVNSTQAVCNLAGSAGVGALRSVAESTSKLEMPNISDIGTSALTGGISSMINCVSAIKPVKSAVAAGLIGLGTGAASGASTKMVVNVINNQKGYSLCLKSACPKKIKKNKLYLYKKDNMLEYAVINNFSKEIEKVPIEKEELGEEIFNDIVKDLEIGARRLSKVQQDALFNVTVNRGYFPKKNLKELTEKEITEGAFEAALMGGIIGGTVAVITQSINNQTENENTSTAKSQQAFLEKETSFNQVADGDTDNPAMLSTKLSERTTTVDDTLKKLNNDPQVKRMVENYEEIEAAIKHRVAENHEEFMAALDQRDLPKLLKITYGKNKLHNPVTNFSIEQSEPDTKFIKELKDSATDQRIKLMREKMKWMDECREECSVALKQKDFSKTKEILSKYELQNSVANFSSEQSEEDSYTVFFKKLTQKVNNEPQTTQIAENHEEFTVALKQNDNSKETEIVEKKDNVQHSINEEQEDNSNNKNIVQQFSMNQSLLCNKSDTEDNWVTIRAWMPKDKDGKNVVAHAAEYLGHATLEIPGEYISFWPDTPSGKKGAILGSSESEFVSSYKKDCRLEGREADLVLTLRSLNVKAIRDRLHLFKTSSESNRWSLLGRNFWNKFNKGAGQSCSGLIYDLLVAGGIFDLEICADFTRDTFTVSPDAIARMAVSAHNDECKKHPEFEKIPEPYPSRLPSKNVEDYDFHSCRLM